MAIRDITDCQDLYCGYKESKCLSGDSTAAIRDVTDCKVPVLWP